VKSVIGRLIVHPLLSRKPLRCLAFLPNAPSEKHTAFAAARTVVSPRGAPPFGSAAEGDECVHPRCAEQDARQHVGRVVDAEHEAAHRDDNDCKGEDERTERLHAAMPSTPPEQEAERERQTGRAHRVAAGEAVAVLRHAEEGDRPLAGDDGFDEQDERDVPADRAEHEQRVEHTAAQQEPPAEDDTYHANYHLRTEQRHILRDHDRPRGGGVVNPPQEALIGREGG